MKQNRKHTAPDLAQMQSLSLDSKIKVANRRIAQWYDYWDGDVYVSFSGGKDSTVLLHLVREMYPDVPGVFADTGLEYPEIRDFVKTFDNITWVKPAMNFKKVIEKYGYPVISKATAQKIHQVIHSSGYTFLMRQRLTGIKKDGTYSPMSKLANKWQRLCGAPFAVSHKCCDVLKKHPMDKYTRETGRYPYIGVMAVESQGRVKSYYYYGCNAFNITRPRSAPLSVWLEEDVWNYIRRFNVPYSPIYDMGYDRTGCMFCMFGVHLEKSPNRFQRMARTHPQQHHYCLEILGLKEVFEFIDVPYTVEQEFPLLQPRLAGGPRVTTRGGD